MSLSLRYALCYLGLACLPTMASGAPGEAAPNIVIILADDLGFSDLGCYGGEIATPHLDALADGGLRYSQFYNCSRCSPTRAALLTGYYAQQVRFDDFAGLPERRGPRQRWAGLLPEYLGPLGYRSYHSGKWHLDGSPLDSGFERSYLINDFDRNFAPQMVELDGQALPPVEPGGSYYTSTAIANRTIGFLKQHAAESSDRPFFAYVAFPVPHFPLQAPAQDVAKYRDRYIAGWDVVRANRWHAIQSLLRLPGELSTLEPKIGPPYLFPEAAKVLGPGEVWSELPWDSLSNEQRTFQAAKMSVHAAMVHRMDHEVGRIVAQLQQMDALENSVIVFLSDNGASAEIMIRGDGHDPNAPIGSAASFNCLGPGWSKAANTPFRRHKTWAHEGGIATPLIVHWPRGISARGELRTKAVGHVVDLAPTILALTGGSRPNDETAPKRPGVDLSATFAADIALDRRDLWWLHEGNRAIRSGNWKLVAARGGDWELYDLSVDRTESHNLAEFNPDKVRQLADVWQVAAEQFKKDRQESDFGASNAP